MASAFTPRAPVVLPSSYTLPVASLSVLGGVKVSTDFDIDGSGVITLKRQSFQFQTGLATPSYSKGNTYWDESNQTLSTDLANNVRLQHGQEIHIIATNVTGSTILNGKCVYISGASGDHPTVALAKADSLLTSDSLIGIATQDILDTASGYITLMGKVRDLDTSAFSVGPVYVSASTAGAFTGTRPAYPNRAIRVGFVTSVSATAGTVLVDIEDYADAQDILLPVSGTPSEVVDVLDWFRHSWSTGLADGGALTNNGDGTINIAASDFLLRQGPSDDSPLVIYRNPGVTNLAIPANDVSYVYLNYNSGSPTWTVSASLSDFNGIDKVITYIVARNGSRLNVVDLRGVNVDSGRKSRRQKVEFDGFVYKGWWRSSLSTSALSSSGLNLLVGTGRYYYFDNPISHGVFDTSVAGTADANTFIYFYNRAGTWSQLIEQKTVNATQYDVAGILTTMTNNRYRTDWVYVVMCAATSNCYLVSILGNAEYASLAAAQAAPLPSTLPPQIDGISVLIGQVVIQKSAATVTIQMAGGVAFTGGGAASDHNSLAGLQGGAATEYYHLTSAQHTIATQAASASVAGYVTTSAQSFAGLKTFTNNIVVQDTITFTASASIVADTSDGSDDQYVSIGGGGAANTLRGATIQLFGNEYAVVPGYLRLYSGTVTGAKIALGAEGNEQLLISAAALTTTAAVTSLAFQAGNPSLNIGTGALTAGSGTIGNATGQNSVFDLRVGSADATTGDNSGLVIVNNATGKGWIGFNRANDASIPGQITYNHNTNALEVVTNGTTIGTFSSTGLSVTGMVSATGNVTLSATSPIIYAGTTTGTGIFANNNTSSYIACYGETHATRPKWIEFSSGGVADRMTLDASGNLLVGSATANAKLYVRGSIVESLFRAEQDQNSYSSYNAYSVLNGTSNNNTTAKHFAGYTSPVGDVFIVYGNGGIANYQANNVNLSDRREKTNFAPAKDYLSIISQIPVKTFNYISQDLETDPGLTLGVVAQDVQAVAPELVMESNWGTDEDPKMRLSIYQTDLQYALMKCIQELKAENDALKARLDAAGL